MTTTALNLDELKKHIDAGSRETRPRMSLLETLSTIDGTAELLKRHHAGILMLFYWNAALTLAVIILAVRGRRKP